MAMTPTHRKATGGAQGRSPVVFKGFSNTRGGSNLKGSQKKDLHAGFFSTPNRGAGSFGFLNKHGNFAQVKDPGKLKALRAGEMPTMANPFRAGLIEFRPAEATAFQPAPQAAQPITNMPSFQDALSANVPLQNQYLTQLAQLQLQRDLNMAPFESQFRSLLTPGSGGYLPGQVEELDRMRQAAERARQERFGSAASGLLNSGARDVGLRDLRSQEEAEKIRVSESSGDRALSNLEQQMAQAQLAFAQQQVPLVLQTAGQAQQGSLKELSDLLTGLIQDRQAQTEQFNKVFGVNF